MSTLRATVSRVSRTAATSDWSAVMDDGRRYVVRTFTGSTVMDVRHEETSRPCRGPRVRSAIRLAITKAEQ